MKFRAVDQINLWESGKRIQGIKAVSFEEYCLRSPLGYEECLPESLAAQSFIGLADWLTILSSDFSRTFFPETIERMEFRGALRPGQRLFLTVEAVQFHQDQATFSGRGECKVPEEDAPRLLFEISGLSGRFFSCRDFFDPDDKQTLFSEIYRP